jgi:hypothetical protein
MGLVTEQEAVGVRGTAQIRRDMAQEQIVKKLE